MAGFGAQYPNFAPIDTQPVGALPTYKSEDKVTIGHLVGATLTVNNATAEMYGDDRLIEEISEFISGSIAMETDDLALDVAGTLFGTEISESGQLGFKSSDTSPPGGLTYIKVLMRNKVKVFKGYYYPLVKASMGNDTATTKSASTNFSSTPTNFTVFPCNDDHWVILEEFDTLAAAKTWCDAQLGVTE
ncbi:hypothetical protein FACS1894208_01230 [Clostridia bacterium]|nr:hypothetical protein FACS1894208_01230 [Clostridia bacterium]